MGKLNKGGLVGGFDQLRAPDAPTIGAATAGDTQVSVAFTAASDAGAGTVSSFVLTGLASGATTGFSGTSSPIVATSLTNDTEVTFSVIAISEFGSSPSSGTVAATPSAPSWSGQRGLFSGGKDTNGQMNDEIEYITITTTGNSQDFGDLSQTARLATACSNGTRGVITSLYGGLSPGPVNVIDFVIIASTGDSTDFGNLAVAAHSLNAVSNGIRGVIAGGGQPVSGNSANIEFIIIASSGNGADFGDLTNTRLGSTVQCAESNNSVRGVFQGGSSSNVIDFVNIASSGNASDFGDLTVARHNAAGFGSATRSIAAGGASITNVIDFMNTASTGNSSDFGDLLAAVFLVHGTSNLTRGVIGGGSTAANESTFQNVMQYITIANTGNSVDFGDLTSSKAEVTATSG